MAVMAALSAGVGPDVVLVNNGEQMMGPMVRLNESLTRPVRREIWLDR